MHNSTYYCIKVISKYHRQNYTFYCDNLLKARSGSEISSGRDPSYLIHPGYGLIRNNKKDQTFLVLSYQGRKKARYSCITHVFVFLPIVNGKLWPVRSMTEEDWRAGEQGSASAITSMGLLTPPSVCVTVFLAAMALCASSDVIISLATGLDGGRGS